MTPFQILSIADASFGVRHVAGSLREPVQTNVCALKWHARGSWRTPSLIPSRPSQAEIAACVAAAVLAGAINLPTSVFWTTDAQSWEGLRRSQFIVGSPARIPSYSSG